MGDDGNDVYASIPTGGETVNAAGTESRPPNNAQPASLGNEPAVCVGLAGSSPALSTTRNKAKRSLNLDIAIQALHSAREGAREVKPGMPRHERNRLLIDPLSQLGLAQRAIDEVRAEWERGVV